MFNSSTSGREDGASLTSVRDHVARRARRRLHVQDRRGAAEEQRREIRALSRSSTTFFIGFAVVALIVGVFLILNTFSHRRRPAHPGARADAGDGASRGQVIGSVLVEAVMVGCSARLSVWPWASASARRSATSWRRAQRRPARARRARRAALGGRAAFAVGVVVTVISALLPALRASRVPPMAAMRDVRGPDKPLTDLTITGAAVAGGRRGPARPRPDRQPRRGRPVARARWRPAGVHRRRAADPDLSPAGRGPARAGFRLAGPGKLGRRNSSRNPRRTAITAAALMVGIAHRHRHQRGHGVAAAQHRGRGLRGRRRRAGHQLRPARRRPRDGQPGHPRRDPRRLPTWTRSSASRAIWSRWTVATSSSPASTTSGGTVDLRGGADLRHAAARPPARWRSTTEVRPTAT